MPFGTIPASQASPVFTTAVEARYDELQVNKVNNFYRSFYREVMSPELYPAIEVRRGSEKVAVDVIRGHQGKRVQVTKYSQKAFEPLYFRQFFDATQLQQYYRVFGSNSFNVNDMAGLANSVATERKSMSDMLERAVEIHCGTIFETGTITAADGTILDFNRKAASMVDNGAGNYWDNPAHDIVADLRAGCDFLRQQGKAQGYYINAIVGVEAFAAMRKNNDLNIRWNQFNNKRDMLPDAQMQSTGAVFQVEIDVDSYKVRVYTYNDVYQNNDDNDNPTFAHYKDPKTVVLLGDAPQFTLFYGAIPRVRTDLSTSGLLVGKMVFRDFVNEELNYHRFYVESAPLPVPVAVDQIYTLQALAG